MLIDIQAVGPVTEARAHAALTEAVRLLRANGFTNVKFTVDGQGPTQKPADGPLRVGDRVHVVSPPRFCNDQYEVKGAGYTVNPQVGSLGLVTAEADDQNDVRVLFDEGDGPTEFPIYISANSLARVPS